MENETNDLPQTQEAAGPAVAVATAGPSRFRRFKSWYGSHKKYSLPLTIILILVVLAAVPWTRYNLAGLVVKKDFTVKVTDSTAGTPVSGAIVRAGAIQATTDADGQAVLRGVKVGRQALSIGKKYYQPGSATVTVGIFGEKQVPDVKLVATGRQVKIKVTNLISGETLADVDVVVAGTSAKTDESGQALLVLPVDQSAQPAKLSLEGYNDLAAQVQISDSSIKENDFKLTPSGKIYYLSNKTGSVNLMKVNLDGSGVEVAVAGTGTEQADNTQMSQSADGKYVALVAKRSSNDKRPQLYVLSTADDKLLQVDNGNAIFQIYDWAGDRLVYTVERQDLPVWQRGVEKIKAYDATTGSTALLDQSAGSDSTVDANEYYSEVMVSANDVIFGKIWQGEGDYGAKQNSLQVIGVDGQGHQTLATYNVNDNLYFAQHSPDTLYIWQHKSDKDTDAFTQYTAGGLVKSLNVNSDQFYQGQTNYYFGPLRQQTFWADSRDGKETLLVGDQSGANTSTVISDSDYTAYGWYTSQYLLVSKNNSELYVMGVKGGTPVKVANYLSSAGFY